MTAKITDSIIERPPIPDSDYGRKFKLRKRLTTNVRRLGVAWHDAVARRLKSEKTHVVICGFPRSGTTLLIVIVESCVDDVHFFTEEYRAIYAARYVRSKHSFLITKRTNDVYWVDEIRDFYASRPTQVRFLLSMRDPRDVLTSFHAEHPGDYYVSTERWQTIYDHLCYARQFPDAHVVRYEDLVISPRRVERQLQQFLGWHWKRPIDGFHEAVPEELDVTELNGLRPLDRTGIGRWKEPQYQERIEQILREIPEMPQYLVKEGYEPDESWAAEYGAA